MSATWNVKDARGNPVDTLEGLAAVLQVDQGLAAKTLVADTDLYEAAPAALQTEAKAKFTAGGGNKPPAIATGSFVSWSGKKGRVDLIVTSGKVPGVTGDVTGTTKTPAARVVVYDSDGKATSEKVGVSTATLKRIPPIQGSQQDPNSGKKKPWEKSADPTALVAVLADHETKCLTLPVHAAVTGGAVKAVYDRGIKAYPGPDRTSLTAEEWALGRVEHFVKVAAGDVADPAMAGHDVDLLHDQHPIRLQRLPAPDGAKRDPAPPATVAQDKPGETAAFMGGKDHVDADADALLAEIAAVTLGLDAE